MTDHGRRDLIRLTGPVALTAEGVELDIDVLAISEDEWAIHGQLAYEGQVIAATFATEDEAWTALATAPGTGEVLLGE